MGAWISRVGIPGVLCVLLAPQPAPAQPPVAEPAETARAPRPGEDEPIGEWRFRTERPVQAVVLGGSVADYRGGNFGDALAEACPGAEIVNISKTGYGAWALKKRFEAQVLKNRRVRRPPADRERWLLFHGGLNSVATPEKTNRHIRDIVRKAHRAGFRIAILSLAPWGDESDKRRWRGLKAIRYREATQKTVDYVMGRLSPKEALGDGAKGATWNPEDQPDIGVDLYDSPLRAADAPLRDRTRLARQLERNRSLRKALAKLPEEARAQERERLLDLAMTAPQYFLREELRAFDHIHPNKRGHRIMASLLCRKLPASWGCACEQLHDASPASVEPSETR